MNFALYVFGTPDSCLLPSPAVPSLYMFISSSSLSSELLAPSDTVFKQQIVAYERHLIAQWVFYACYNGGR